MDKLTTSQQTAIKKLTNLKLMAKLLEAGIDEQVVTQMDRKASMNAWADIVATSKEKGSESTAAQANSLASYNAEVEKLRLEIEIEMKELALREKEYEDRKRRLDEEREERKRKEEDERRREIEEREERNRREEIERE